MANLDFFGAHDDLVSVFEFLFANTDVCVFESYSRYDEELRQFHSISEIEQSYQLGEDRYGKGTNILLKLWSPSIMAELNIKRISLDPKYCNGHTFRYNITGGGLIQLYLGGIYKNCITKSHYGHFSQKGAQAWGLDQGTDWNAHARLSRKIQYHIRSRLAVAGVQYHFVLPQAYELARQGYELKESANLPWHYELEIQSLVTG